ncbi:MAG: hypothetical protein ABSE56_23160 [Bryobacteraceae bacterium]
MLLARLACLCGLWVGSCSFERGHPPQLQQVYRCEGSHEDCASLIVVAKTKSLRDTGQSQELAKDNGRIETNGPTRTSLYEVEADVENVLKGSLKGRTVKYYFWGHPLGEPIIGFVPFFPAPGERHVLELRQEGDVLRTVIDYFGAPDDRVLTGFHAPEFVRPE